MNRLIIRLTALFILTIQGAIADVRLPAVFSQHMVLQRRKPVPVWGWAEPGEKVTVSLNGQTQTVKTGKDGKWQVSLKSMEAGGPFRMQVSSVKNTLSIDDILVGEVWICSGQSNMEWPLQAAANAKSEIPLANYPTIRQLLVKKDISLTPKDQFEGSWSVCTPETAPRFTAVGYFFARQLQQELHVPIGIINTSWGGTHSETWTSRKALNEDADLRALAERLPADRAEVIKSGAERIRKLLELQQGGLPTAAELRTWPDSALQTKTWRSMNVLGDWEWKGLPTLDGVVWFRREINVPQSLLPKQITLEFGPIDDADSTYVNGRLVGSTNDNRNPRHYVLPEGLLKPGRNVIAVRVQDNGGSGGFMGNPEQLKLSGEGLLLPLSGDWQYRVASVSESSYEPGPNTYPTLLFNAMLHPLIPYAIAGTIWYQGESNAGRAYQYRTSFPLMIRDWRKHWGYDFPFLFVQLANYNAGNGDSRRGSSWAELREAQSMTLQLPFTGMAVTSDIGERSDIHPRNKEDVGKRLAAEAMRIAYQKAGISSGPAFEQVHFDKNTATLTFRNVGGGLFAKDKYGYVKGFEVAGEDRKFHYAKAEIQNNTLVVYSDSVTAPVAVRYGWADDNGDVNVYNREGFPMVPFRTDTWKGVTETAKFSF